MIYDLLPLYGLVGGFGLGVILTALYYRKQHSDAHIQMMLQKAKKEFEDKENERKKKFGY